MVRLFFYIFNIIIYILISCTLVKANTISSKGTGINLNWNDTSAWIDGVIPANGDDVVISDNDTITCDQNSVSIAAVQIDTSAVLIVSNNPMIINGNLTIKQGGTLNSSTIIVVTITIFNNGTINFNGGRLWPYRSLANNGSISGTNLFNLSIGSGQGVSNRISGSGTFGSPTSPIPFFNVYDNLNISVSDSIYASRIFLYSGRITHADKLVLGDGVGPLEIWIGNQNHFAEASFDTFPGRYNIANDMIRLYYSGFPANHATGCEIPPSRIINILYIDALPINDHSNIILRGGDLTINNEIYFQGDPSNERRFYLGNNNIYFKGNTITGASKDSGFFVTDSTGYFKWDIHSGDTKLFPIGADTNSFDPVIMKFDLQTTPDVFGARVNKNLSQPATDTSKIINREWDIFEGTPGGNIVDLSFICDTAAEWGTNFDSSEQNIIVGHYTGGYWHEMPAVKSGDTITINGITSFSPFVVGNPHSLPVSLLSFSAVKKDNYIVIKWNVANEPDSKYYEIERSTNGIAFTTVANIAARNMGGIVQNYQYEDRSIVGSIVYYRIKQVDFNGKYTYSQIVSIKTNPSLFSIYPNPVKDRLIIRQMNDNVEKIFVRIYNNKGAEVYCKNINIQSGVSNIDLSKLSAGNYDLLVSSQKGLFSVPFIKL